MAIKVINVILLASVKYFLTFPYSLIIGLDYELAMVSVIVGGVAGFFFFYYLSNRVLSASEKIRPLLCAVVPGFLKARYRSYREKRNVKVKKLFTKKTRFIARLKSNYGLWGIIITTPVLLTIPLGAFLANKYYSRRRYVVLYMVLSIVGWGAVLSAFLHIFPAFID